MCGDEYSSAFSGNGVARLSDLAAKEYVESLSMLDLQQSDFLRLEDQFRSPEYRWPRDPLHTWSRVWEYPYAYHHIAKACSQQRNGKRLKVLDFGSGVTFFPFSVARLGCDVVCADIDPVCISDLERATKVTAALPGTVTSCQLGGDQMPIAGSSMDLVYSISVIEHIPHFAPVVDDIARVLKPGGMLILTVDLSLDGTTELGIDAFRSLMVAVNRAFLPVMPSHIVHPADILTSRNSPYSSREMEGWAKQSWHFAKQAIIKPVLGRPSARLRPPHLAVAGGVFSRR